MYLTIARVSPNRTTPMRIMVLMVLMVHCLLCVACTRTAGITEQMRREWDSRPSAPTKQTHAVLRGRMLGYALAAGNAEVLASIDEISLKCDGAKSSEAEYCQLAIDVLYDAMLQKHMREGLQESLRRFPISTVDGMPLEWILASEYGQTERLEGLDLLLDATMSAQEESACLVLMELCRRVFSEVEEVSTQMLKCAEAQQYAMKCRLWLNANRHSFVVSDEYVAQVSEWAGGPKPRLLVRK
jgi:hypothetical protein